MFIDWFSAAAYANKILAICKTIDQYISLNTLCIGLALDDGFIFLFLWHTSPWFAATPGPTPLLTFSSH